MLHGFLSENVKTWLHEKHELMKALAFNSAHWYIVFYLSESGFEKMIVQNALAFSYPNPPSSYMKVNVCPSLNCFWDFNFSPILFQNGQILKQKSSSCPVSRFFLPEHWIFTCHPLFSVSVFLIFRKMEDHLNIFEGFIRSMFSQIPKLFSFWATKCHQSQLITQTIGWLCNRAKRIIVINCD